MIRAAKENDYLQLANMKWEHCKEDDEVYGERNLEGVDKEAFIDEFICFLKKDKTYQIFVLEENEKIISAMFVSMIPKVPKPNGNAEYIAYLTNVHTLKDYRNQGKGTELLKEIKQYLEQKKCELIIVWPSDNSMEWYQRNGFYSENEVFECDLIAG